MKNFDKAILKLSKILAIADGAIDVIRIDEEEKKINISVGFSKKALKLFNSIGIPEHLENIKIDSDPKYVMFNHVKNFDSKVFGYDVVVTRFEYILVDKFIERYEQHPDEFNASMKSADLRAA